MTESAHGSDAVQRVADWLREARCAAAFTGAGVSTESGIPDFRSPGGVWATNQPVMFDDFQASASARQEYWRQKSISHDDFSQSTPNAGHRTLAKWEQAGRLRGVITQNIDGLHQDAGSSNVIELHGTARFVSCLSCSFREPADPWVERFRRDDAPPACPDCGGLLKHATVSFGQSLPEDVLQAGIELSHRCDLFLAMGSSLVVTPAATLPQVAKRSGARLVIINRDETPLDALADQVINASIGETLTAVDALL